MKTRYLLLLLFLPHLGLFAQDTKGATPLSTPSTVDRPPSTVRAVVVGISNYQDPQIPDLQFADRDAEAFAAWLQSPAGGSVPADNIQLLTNSNATNAQIGLALYWLVDSSRAGDIALIYFSGHGDLDSKKLRDQWGYLLTYDTKAAIYSAGAYPLNYLQNIISTLSLDQQVSVELFLDACHAGKLAGEAIGGGQATAQSLARQFANEVKVLSCQPNEFSLEGRQWGGGRGVFSWHLVNGLTGLADLDRNGVVTLKEINSYLGDVVPAETAPQPQTPFTVGNLYAQLARVDQVSLAALSATGDKTGNLHPIEIKGLEDEVLAKADSAGRSQYHAFKNALATRYFLESDLPTGGEQSADFFYNQLIQNEVFKPLFGVMRRNFAAALADDAQQALNAILSDDPFEINNWTLNPTKYRQYPLYLQRALELIGESNYLYRPLMAKKLYFEGYNLYFGLAMHVQRPALRDSLRQEARKLFGQCLEYEPGAAYACYSIGGLTEMTGNSALADSNIIWLKKAAELAPNWKQPYVNIAEVYMGWLVDLDQANEWLTQAYALDSTSYLVLQQLSWLRQYQHRPEEANAICRKLIALRPDLPNAYNTLATTLLFLQGEVTASEANYRKAIEVDSTAMQYGWAGISVCPAQNMFKSRRLGEAVACLTEGAKRQELSTRARSYVQTLLAQAYVQLRDFGKAEEIIQKTEQIPPVDVIFTLLEAEKGRMQLLQGRLDEAEKTLRYALTLDATDDDCWIRIWALLGCVKAAQNQPAEAEALFKKAVAFWGANTANLYWEEAWFLYGQFLLTQNRDTEAFQAFEKTEAVYPNGYFAPYGRALLEAKKGHPAAALDWLERALDRYYPVAWPIDEEPLFTKIRRTKRFKTLMAKNFPPGWEER